MVLRLSMDHGFRQRKAIYQQVFHSHFRKSRIELGSGLLSNCFFLNTYLLTNTWLRPVEEDLSMSACIEHSASNIWPLGPGYRYSLHLPIWILVFLDFSFHCVWLWIELFVVGLRVFWSCVQRNAICLSSWHLGHSGCWTPYQVRR
jgi:hypothetical protein